VDTKRDISSCSYGSAHFLSFECFATAWEYIYLVMELPPLVAGSWPRDLEIQLFDACAEHRPVGVDRHFRMVSILRHLRQWHPDLTTKHIWDHLNTAYDLSALEGGVGGEKDDPDEREFPFNHMPDGNDTEDFNLPSEGIFADRVEALLNEDNEEEDGGGAPEEGKADETGAGSGKEQAAEEDAEEEVAPPPKSSKSGGTSKSHKKGASKAAAAKAAAEAKAKAEAEEAEAAAKVEAEAEAAEASSSRRSRSAGGKGGGEKSEKGSSPKKAKKEPKSRPKRKK